LAASFISKHMHDVAFWHLADNPVAHTFVRFWTKADNGGFWPAMVCPLMTQSGLSETDLTVMRLAAPVPNRRVTAKPH